MLYTHVRLLFFRSHSLVSVHSNFIYTSIFHLHSFNFMIFYITYPNHFSKQTHTHTHTHHPCSHQHAHKILSPSGLFLLLRICNALLTSRSAQREDRTPSYLASSYKEEVVSLRREMAHTYPVCQRERERERERERGRERDRG